MPEFVIFIINIRLLTLLSIVAELSSRPYHTLTHCLETISEFFNCFYPNSDTQEFFLHVHSLYFHNCSREEFHMEDAPDSLVVALTLIPISLIPVLVYLLLWSSAAASSSTDQHS